MYKILVLIGVCIASANASAKFTVLSKPDGVTFKGHERIDEGDLKEVYSAALGFSIEEPTSWTGMYIEDPFRLSEAVVEVHIDGLANLNLAKGHIYPMVTNERALNWIDEVTARITDRFGDGKSKLVSIDLAEGQDAVALYKLLASNKVQIKRHRGSLSMDTDADRTFLEEVALLESITSKVEKSSLKDNTPDLYWFKLSGMESVVEMHGNNSTQVKDAREILSDVLGRLADAFKKAYDGSVLVTVVSMDSAHYRVTRDVGDEPKADPSTLKLASSYSKEYPVIFNIILWFGVAFFFSLLAICITIASMDPGRDSIIYRMTSNRMKKDN